MARRLANMTIKRKLKNKSGFTLAETLLAVLILLLVSVIVANGIPVARNVYNNVIVGANAQMLLSTAVTALRNELGTARDVKTDSIGTYITYFNAEREAYSMICLAEDSNIIQVEPYIVKSDSGDISPVNGSKRHDLVSRAASNKDLYITYSKVKRDKNAMGVFNDFIVFENLAVKRINGGNSVITSIDKLEIRLVPIADSEA